MPADLLHSQGPLQVTYLGIRPASPVPQSSAATAALPMQAAAALFSLLVVYGCFTVLNSILGMDTLMWWMAVLICGGTSASMGWAAYRNWGTVIGQALTCGIGGHLLFWVLQYLD